VQAAAQFGILLLAIHTLLPEIWARQIAAGPIAFILTFLVAHLLTAFVEWFFHRYVLHSVASSWLRRFAEKHRNHHALTRIQLKSADVGDGRIILNRYPIVDQEQFEDSAFPPYALVAFWLLYTPFLILAQQVFPHAPIYLAGYSALTWSTVSYEIFHAIEHRPYEWWKHATEHHRFGPLWRKIYGFHHFHHANVNANEGISGFFGFPVPDWVFRTYHQPPDLLLEGRIASARDFAVRPPWGFVVKLDRWVRRREARSAKRSR
jgi:hemolysin III